MLAAFPWGGHHLHEFCTRSDCDAERFHCRETIEDAESEDTPEWEVRLDQVMQLPGDRLHYWYDFGGDWYHTLKLEKVMPRPADALVAKLVGGRRAAPPDD